MQIIKKQYSAGSTFSFAGRYLHIMSITKAPNIISITEVYEIHEQRDIYIFDVNPAWMYQQHHIPDAFNIGVYFSESSIPQDKEAMLIFYSHNAQCRNSSLAARHALKMGYNNIWIMKAGITGWMYNNFPVASSNRSRKKQFLNS
jgi:rhodanese-related sulfurtransferase